MRYIFLDVDGVLVQGYGRNSTGVQWDANLEHDFGIVPEDFRRHFILKSFINEVLPGRRTLADALAEALPGLGYTGEVQPLIRYWLENDSQLNHQLINDIAGLAGRDDIALYIATNQEEQRANYLWNELGFHHYFRDMFYAARIGAMKPNVEFFEAIEAVLDFGDRPPLLFDDDPRVVEVADALGWEAVRYEHIRDFREHEAIRTLHKEGVG